MKNMTLREIEREIENAGVHPANIEAGLSGKKVLQDHEKPIRYSRRNNYHGKKGIHDETE